MKFSKIRKDYFIFSRKERNASIVLILIITGAILFPPIENLLASKSPENDYALLYDYFDSIKETENNFFDAENSFRENTSVNFTTKSTDHSENEKAVRELFYFDPNRIGEEEWLKMGINENIAKRIINYRNKGGVFKAKSDLLKIYGFSDDDFDAIEKYIVIDSVQSKKLSANQNDDIPFAGERKQTDLNSATIDQLTALGFSKEIAARILNFIKGVGGVYSADQLITIYGIDEEQLNEIRPFLIIDQTKMHLLNMNSATEEELAQHSYISDELAHAIISYRDASGRFVSVSEIMKVKGMYPALFEKLKPYLTI